MFCTGKGGACGANAPDGWQVKCAGTYGGLKQEESVSVSKEYGQIGRQFRKWFSEAKDERDYVDPTGWRDFEQDKNSFSKEDVLEIVAYLSILHKEDEKNKKIKTVEKEVEGKMAAVAELEEGSLLRPYKTCYNRVQPFATQALTGKHYESYKMLNHAYGVPIAFRAEAGKFKEDKPEKKSLKTKLAGLLGAEEKETKEKETKEGKTKEIQKALVEFFGPESEVVKNMEDELKTGTYGINTQTAFMQFRKGYADKDFPTGKRAINKLPKYIREKIPEKEYREAAAKGGGGFVAEEGKNYLKQKRLQKLNERLYKKYNGV